MIRIDEEQYEHLQAISEVKGKSITSCLKEILDGSLNQRITPIQPLVTRPLEKFDESLLGVPTPGFDPNKRTKSDILKDIDSTKAILKEETDYCQDFETKRKIEIRYNEKISKLWDEYNEQV